MIKYRMKHRPPGFATLPARLWWDWVEIPRDDHWLADMRPSLPRSTWRFGVFQTERPLTPEELRDYEIEEVP